MANRGTFVSPLERDANLAGVTLSDGDTCTVAGEQHTYDPENNGSGWVSPWPRDVEFPEDVVGDTLVSSVPIIGLFGRTLNIAPRRGFGTYWIYSDTPASGNTCVVRLQAPPGAVGAYLHFQHWGANPADVEKAGVLAVANATANTATSAFTPVTFKSAQSGVIPGWIAGKYPSGDKNYAQELVSDYVALSPVARSDFPNRGPLFDVAFKVGARPITAGTYSPTDSGNTPWVVGWTNGSTDLIAAPTPTTMYPYMGTFVWAEWVYSGQRRPVAAAFGDSIFDGISASNILDGYLQNACYSAGVELYSNAVGGRTSFDTWDVMRAELPKIAHKVDAVFMTAWTPNDAVQGYAWDSVWARFLVEKAWVESLGLKALIMGPLPYSGSNIPGLVRSNLIAAGFQFLDIGPVLATNNTLLTWKASYTGDNIHPNSAGYDLLTGILRPWLTTILVPWEIPLYDAYSDLPKAGVQLGKEARVKRLSGTGVTSTGYFAVQWNGTRWEVKPGESVVADSTETPYTSVGTTLVVLKSALIPAGLVGDNELWEASIQTTQVSGTFDAANSHQLRIGGAAIWNNPGAVSSVPYSFDVYPRRLRRAGTTARRYSASLWDSFGADEAQMPVNLSSDQVLDCSITPAAIGNVYRARRLVLRRVG